ncbi:MULTISPECIES: hypothetical protein [Gammaproteobacteria]|jgi:hypothetical protein|uniref:hypothetical protein n=1 Tax=Gammaproteobacteria TaxID=1236 RepID=UPI000C256E98|nr:MULTISPECIES: hypothetical protein [Stenotrophomonas]MBN5099205.1 hypothetical protein [Stenotrophomonas maltophilia]MCU1057709.1 hypothetical protein [Stenotrophomonas maltophilia]MDH1244951.1 hypothetical protein [Stenotrophomonas sp. GD03948]MDH1579180.1 hypothetical protein [Stenotrophomonas sp. GD03744]PJL79328.1 hypothetical protein B9Y88_03550 [Stenotrophomonas maltophilia]
MTFWRMQLHPSDSTRAVAHTTRSLGLGYVGLDFADPPGDLTDVKQQDIDQSQRDYWDFAHCMDVGDIILVVAHHYPCALARVTGPYNYIRAPEVELGVWFRHFRKIEVLGYYADIVTHPAKWEKTTMTDTISILRDPDGVSHQLISKWLAKLGE